ncbi:hypothetical protein QEH52_16650 [Coraliomargarita sp. SDUM461003]|uniref:Oligosaccharide repeat unit polymerase n=1 Tax=Thalassobacterium maritimum TaxID=3041265 RepID=A0ABU1AYB9_9BACT|nr:hypothetical protein [Coraliomargarita sp. SDUM461003]MDQ8209158.1 hypothetical protein [Coraliomargarita sp. SDUM461003]
MGELNLLIVGPAVVLCLINIFFCVRDLFRYEMQSLFAGMVLIYVPTNLYGMLLLPFIELKAIHEQKFSYEILSHQYLGFLVLNFAVFAMFLVREFLMRNRPPLRSNFASIRLHGFLANGIFWFTVFYSCLFILMKRGRLADFIRIVASGNFQAYYNYRKELIFEKATTNFLINNLDSIFVYGMLYFFVGLFAWNYFRLKRFDYRLFIVTPLLLLTAVLRFQKAPLVIALCAILFAWIYSRRFSSKALSNFIKVIFGGGVVLIVIYMIYSLLGFEGSILHGLHDRILVSPAFTSYGFYWTFPDHHGFLRYGGSRTFNLIFGFGQDRELLTYLGTAPLIVSQFFYGATEFFNFNTGILGEGYAQNGYWGVAQAAFVLFGVFLWWDYIFLKRSPWRAYAPVLIFCFSQFMVILNSGMLSIFSTGFLLIPMMYCMMFWRQR